MAAAGQAPVAADGETARLRLDCRGVVQGVGFRPAVHRLASRLGLGGSLDNGPEGVRLDLVGRRADLECFLASLGEALPPAARLERLEPQWLDGSPSSPAALAMAPDGTTAPRLTISAEPAAQRIPSAGDATSPLTIGAEPSAAAVPLGIGLVARSLVADRAPCPACRRELDDPRSRRYGDPFLSCCDCGPRYSIATAEPWRRAHTTLAAFEPCPACAAEFADPADRRFHAETISCPACGPRLSLVAGVDPAGPGAGAAWLELELELELEPKPESEAKPEVRSMPMPWSESEPMLMRESELESKPMASPSSSGREQAGTGGLAESSAARSARLIAAAAELLAEGQILALQGVGGFQLLVDASNPAAVARLRRRKRRPARPFALLVADPAWLELHLQRNPAAQDLLESPAAPIVLLPRRSWAGGAPAGSVAHPGSRLLGAAVARHADGQLPDSPSAVAHPEDSEHPSEHPMVQGALVMAPLEPLLDRGRQHWDFFLGLPEVPRAALNLHKVGQQQLQQPLFEFSGACAGCGETPYLKLASQLFGDRMVVANATGCSSIYGGNLPTTPWSTNAAGRGPAWCNSLFEDNAEFGFGLRVALDQQREMAAALLRQLAGLESDTRLASSASGFGAAGGWTANDASATAGGSGAAGGSSAAAISASDGRSRLAGVSASASGSRAVAVPGAVGDTERPGDSGAPAVPPAEEPSVAPGLAAAILVALDQQSDEPAIHAQRERVEALKRQLHTQLESLPAEGRAALPAARLLAIADSMVKTSVWLVGGDGWAYDIGFGGLDHVLASGRDVNALVLDTEVYSNTGGQASKATPLGAVAKFAAGGKASAKKDLGLMAITYGTVYVASVAMGARDEHTIRAFLEAESYAGPSLILAYSHCIAHGIAMERGMEQQRLAVASGRWPLYRHDPRRAERGENPLQLDSPAPTIPLAEAMASEQRFRLLASTQPERSRELARQAQAGVDRRWALLQKLAGRG